MIDVTKLQQQMGATQQPKQPTQPPPVGQTFNYGTSTGQLQNQMQAPMPMMPTLPQQSTTPNVAGSGMVNRGGFMEPEEWGGASQAYSQMAEGYRTPEQQMASQFFQQMMGGGDAVDVSGWADAYRPVMMTQWEDAAKQLAEQAGVGGTRFSTPLQANIIREGGRLANEFALGMADRYLGAQEAARQRMMGAGQGMMGLGGLGAEQMLAGAGGLASLGQQRAMLPLQVGSAMGSLGSQLTQQQMLPYQIQAGMLGQPYAQQQTYQPNFWTQAAGFATQAMPFLSGLFGGGGNIGETPVGASTDYSWLL